jgi:5-methyltetrahydrofolate--homocysteine methyltransferase
VDRVSLFRGQWRFRKGKMDRAAWEAFAAERLEPIFRDRVSRWRADGTIAPRAAYGFFEARADGPAITVLDGAGGEIRLDFPETGGRSHADAVGRGGGAAAAIGALVATVGPGATRLARELFEAGSFEEYLYLHGIAVEMAEAAAEWIHRRMRAEWGLDPAKRRRGRRVSFGYPGCPPLGAQPALLALLGADRVGVTLTDGLQMVPEQSVSAIVLPV